MKALSSADIRRKFLEYFGRQKHRVVDSSPLVPRNDPTLLFANAGMNQFKGVFLGEEKRDYKRAVSVQKCMRAGGKHNDLENVGRTSRHHTFFEMLGNFSFGDYFKKEAIHYAWEFVTKEMGLPKDRLYASIFRDDDTAHGLWKKEAGLSEDRIFRFGEKDNFWMMGETGPCGPCSEIYFDRGKESGCGKPICTVGCDCDRYVEIWNLVFMEFNQQRDGTREKLPKPSIDTGMGLERLAAIVQGVPGNFEGDLFRPLLDRIGRKAGVSYADADGEKKVSMRVIADHLRAMTFLIADGVMPSNEGRGYVLRRIMRRGMRHARKLGIEKPFLFEAAAGVTEAMGDFYKELSTASSQVSQTIRGEEERFSATIDKGLDLLSKEMEALKKQGATQVAGPTAFRLYDTYGFPVDMTADILRDAGMTVDMEGYDEAFQAHREKARGSWKGSGTQAIDELARKWAAKRAVSEFLGYDHLSAEGTILALVKDGKETDSASEGDSVELLADRTPFYGESGGQVGDIGEISGEGFSLEVVDTKKPSPQIIVHDCRVTQGKVRKGTKALFSVDPKARASTAKNHTATHMLHATLKEVLGEHVKQAGSLVAPERLRFDFSHPKALTPAEITAIEQKMNERIWLGTPVTKTVMPYDKALKEGAVALFNEKYGDTVRVITVGDYSKELCGGTHLDRVGEIGIFKIVKEGSLAAGVRRLEAFTGPRALRYVLETDQKLKGAAALLGVGVDEVTQRVEKLISRQRALEKGAKKERVEGSPRSENETEVAGVKIMTVEAGETDPKDLRELADRYQERIQSGIVVIGSKREGKAFLVVKVSKDLAGRFSAGTLIQGAAKILQGSGGGRPEMAQAGGPAVDQLPEALRSVGEALRSA